MTFLAQKNLLIKFESNNNKNYFLPFGLKPDFQKYA
jgi:hypothetical protein